MKLKESFIVHNLDETQVMVNTSNDKNAFRGLIKSNESAAFIISLLKEEKTKDELVAAFLEEYDVDKQEAEKAVECVIKTLKDIGAIE